MGRGVRPRSTKNYQLLEIAINFHEIYENSRSLILVFEEVFGLIGVEQYFKNEGHTIDSVTVLWIQILMTLELLRKHGIYLVNYFNFH